jgi:hypothetical protein
MTVYDIMLPEFKSPEYRAKMLHEVPDAPVVDRAAFIMEQAKGKRVLNLGCASGGLHGLIQAVARSVAGVDKQPGDWIVCDIDKDPDRLSIVKEIELVVAGEILEHLANPGRVLDALRWLRVPLLITAPNAFAMAGMRWMADGIENVNKDHVAWYSYWTMKALVERYGFAVKTFAWYNGKPRTAEGLIFLVN